MLARAAIALLALAGIGAAHAQLSGSATLVSDYRFRGDSLSDERPAVQAALEYDHASGAYAGLFVSTVRLVPDHKTGHQAVAHVGYALRSVGGLSWDVGAAYSDFSRLAVWNYTDYHVGVAHVNWSMRLSYAPRYLGRSYAARYAELNLTPRSERALVPVLHVGWLNAGAPPEHGLRSRWDGRVGLAYSRESTTLQVSWVTVSRAIDPASRERKGALVARVTRWL